MYVCIPIFLLILPIDFFDSGNSICISKFLLDVECYACGLTRAIMHLIHLDIDGALSYNKLSIIVLPLLFYVWLSDVIRNIKSVNKTI